MKRIISSIISCLPLTAIAHPGHPTIETVHHHFHPEHVTAILVLGAIFVFFYWLRRSK